MCCLVRLAVTLGVDSMTLWTGVSLVDDCRCRYADIFIKTIHRCCGWRYFSCAFRSGQGSGPAVFRPASGFHIHSHCQMLLPLMSRLEKGKPNFGKRLLPFYVHTCGLILLTTTRELLCSDPRKLIALWKTMIIFALRWV